MESKKHHSRHQTDHYDKSSHRRAFAPKSEFLPHHPFDNQIRPEKEPQTLFESKRPNIDQMNFESKGRAQNDKKSSILQGTLQIVSEEELDKNGNLVAEP